MTDTDRLRREIEAIKPWEFHHAGIVDEFLPRPTVMALLVAAGVTLALLEPSDG